MDLSLKKVSELLAICKEKGVKGYSGKKKEELITLLQRFDSPQTQTLTFSKPREQKEIIPSLPPAFKTLGVKTKTPINPEVKTLGVKTSLVTLPTIGCGLESVKKELEEFLNGPPKICNFYGPSGSGKTFILQNSKLQNLLEFFSEDSSIEQLLFQTLSCSSFERRIVIVDNCEKNPIPKPPKEIHAHCILVSTEKLTSISTQIKVKKPTPTAIVSYLSPFYPNKSKEELLDLCHKNSNDIRHIRLILDTKFRGEKDTIIEKDVFSAMNALYNPTLTFDKRVENTILDLHFTQLLAHQELPSASLSLDTCVRGYELLCMSDCIGETRPREALIVATISRAIDCSPKQPPFHTFPQWFGKYSKTEKHKRFFQTKKKSLEELFLLREKILEETEDSKSCFKALEKYKVTPEEFEQIEEFYLEGSEINSLEDPLWKEVKKLYKSKHSD